MWKHTDYSIMSALVGFFITETGWILNHCVVTMKNESGLADLSVSHWFIWIFIESASKNTLDFILMHVNVMLNCTFMPGLCCTRSRIFCQSFPFVLPQFRRHQALYKSFYVGFISSLQRVFLKSFYTNQHIWWCCILWKFKNTFIWIIWTEDKVRTLTSLICF